MSLASRLGRRLVAAAAGLWASDRVVASVILGFALTQLSTLFWDLPGSHGWENDGVAPRDIFAGFSENLTPGHGHRYPLLHYLVLALPSLPILLAAVLAGPLDFESVRGRILSVPCMTGLSLVAKLVAIAMACLSLLVLARIVRRTVGPRAARWTVLFGATNLTFAYYGRVSNLDVPYLTFVVLALDALLELLATGKKRSYAAFALFAAASVATKDQAYASFVLVAPLYLVVLPLVRRSDFAPDHFRRLLRAAVLGALGYGVMSGALFNPTGFLARLRELRGPASGMWRVYSRDGAGVAANASDIVHALPDASWPAPVLGAAVAGALATLFARRGQGLVTGTAGRALPFVAGASNLLFFTLYVARSEHRFLLPFTFFLAAYAGAAADCSLSLTKRASRERLATLLLAALVGWSALRSFAVHLTQLGDARRKVSAWLARLPAGSTVETYGRVVYQPHYDVTPQSPYRVQRVGPERPLKRNPLVGATELEAAIGDIERRKPDVLVIPEGFANAFLAEQRDPTRPLAGVTRERQADTGTVALLRAATENRLPHYRLALHARPALPAWALALGLEPVAIQASTGMSVWVLERSDD